VAELVINSGDDSVLRSHRREIVVVFCDLRGFTTFAESSEPEEVMAVLEEYHAALGELIYRYQGTLERFTGDGLMVFFNDPILLDEPAQRAVEMALAMRDRVATLIDGWSRLGHDLGFGVGIAQGFATLGRIGYEGRFDYAAIGTVTNLAARLCAEAKPGQVLVAQRVFHAVENHAVGESIGVLELRGFSRPVRAFSVSRVIDDSVEVSS
jgi:class 3 adenylate cyclase